MKTKVLLTTLATAAVTLSWAQAAEEQLPRDQQLGRAVPAPAVMDRNVVTQDGREMGQIEDVVFDLESGRILFLALDLKGAGANDTVAVPPALFTYGRGRALAQQEQDDNGNIRARAGERHPFVVRASEEALKGAPKYAKTGEDRAQGAYVDKVYAHFNQPRWWQGANDSAAGRFNHARRASQLKNWTVQNSSNEKLGQVETVLFDLPAGRVSFVVLNPANRVAAGEKLIPLPPMALTRGEQNPAVLILGVDNEKLNNAPSINRAELNADDIRRLSNPAFATKVYQYYGKQPWFQSIPSPTGAESGERQLPLNPDIDN